MRSQSTFPGREKKAVAGFTVVVLVLVLVVSFFILLVDFLISKGVGVFV
ncbi:MAG: preprotein translocase subunit SecE [bacterium]